MKPEINEILEVLDVNEDLAELRSEVYALTSENRGAIEVMISSLLGRIRLDEQNAGFYHLFIACCYYEIAEYRKAELSIISAGAQNWEPAPNRAIVHWLAGLIYNELKEYPKARREIGEAYNLIKIQKSYSPRVDYDNALRKKIKTVIENRRSRLENTPLYQDIKEELNSKNDYKLYEKPGADEKSAQVVIVNENYPVNKLTIGGSGSRSTKEAREKEEAKNDRQHENRTDDADFLHIRSIPVYEQEARAGKSGEIELTPRQPESYTEVQQVIIENKLHDVHSLRFGTKQINITAKGSWGWMGVTGKSMNKLNIEEGDHILFQYNPAVNDNDIVIANYQDKKTGDALVIVKRFKQNGHFLVSETTESGPEYEPIDMEKEGAQIIGIVYAVAKPVQPDKQT